MIQEDVSYNIVANRYIDCVPSKNDARSKCIEDQVPKALYGP